MRHHATAEGNIQFTAEEEAEWDAREAQAAVEAPAREALRLRESAKQARTAAIEAITVTTAAGNTFDGDETSQTRLARKIIELQATNTPSVNWVLANNTAIQATAAELVEALALSGAAQAAVWVL